MILHVSCSWARSNASKDQLQSEFLQAALSVWKAEKYLCLWLREVVKTGGFFLHIMILNLKWQQMRNYCLGFSADSSWAMSKLFHGTSENIFLTAKIINVFRSKGVFGFGPHSQHESFLLIAAQAPCLGEWLRAWCGPLCSWWDSWIGLHIALGALRAAQKQLQGVKGSSW